MAKAKCISCGAECCSCWGCNPSIYFVDGLCPTCHENKIKQCSTQSSTNVPTA